MRILNLLTVTPHIGVWITTFLCLLFFTITFIYILNDIYVTPHVGVWIETLVLPLILL